MPKEALKYYILLKIVWLIENLSVAQKKIKDAGDTKVQLGGTATQNGQIVT